MILTRMKARLQFAIAVLFSAAIVFYPTRQTSAEPPTMKVVESANDVQWGPGPPSLPSGAELAGVSGNPSKSAATYALRLKLSDGYVFPPHWHPQDVNVTVLSGSLGIGMGDKFDRDKGQIVKTGGYILEPKKMHHYAWAQGPTVIEVYGQGPFGMNYVNPGDDPRAAHGKQL